MTLPRLKSYKKFALILLAQIKNLKPIPKRLLQCIWVVIPINQSPSALQNDSEYKTLLSEARQAAKEMDHHEQHELCEEVVNYKD